jgi:hypothetical protein
MRLRNLFVESDEEMKVKKEVSLAVKMKQFYSVIIKYELEKKIHPDDKAKIETLKDFLTAMVKQSERREA